LPVDVPFEPKPDPIPAEKSHVAMILPFSIVKISRDE
jgi:hypothetical protein